MNWKRLWKSAWHSLLIMAFGLSAVMLYLWVLNDLGPVPFAALLGLTIFGVLAASIYHESP